MGRAFTLVEILTVVVILGIAAAVVIPQMGSREDLVVGAGARVVMSDLMYAQTRALTTQKTQYVVFDSDAQTVRVMEGQPMAQVSHPVTHMDYVEYFQSDRNSGLKQVQLVSAKFGTSAVVLAFNSLGEPLAASNDGSSTTPMSASGQVVVRSGATDITIQVEPYTGEMSVQ